MEIWLSIAHGAVGCDKGEERGCLKKLVQRRAPSVQQAVPVALRSRSVSLSLSFLTRDKSMAVLS